LSTRLSFAYKLSEGLLGPETDRVKDGLHPHTYLAEIINFIWEGYESKSLSSLQIRKKLDKLYDAEELYLNIAEKVLSDNSVEMAYRRENRYRLFTTAHKIKEIRFLRKKIDKLDNLAPLESGALTDFNIQYQLDSAKNKNDHREFLPRLAIQLIGEFYTWHTGARPTRQVYSASHPQVSINSGLEGKTYGEFKKFAEPIWHELFKEIDKKIPSFDSNHQDYASEGYIETKFRFFVKEKYPENFND